VSGGEGKGSEVSGARGAAADRSCLRSEDGSHGRRRNQIATEVKKKQNYREISELVRKNRIENQMDGCVGGWRAGKAETGPRYGINYSIPRV
jgi:hypothetical protein